MTPIDIPPPTDQDEDGTAQPVAVTAGEEDRDPRELAGEDVDPPVSTDEDRAAVLRDGSLPGGA